MASRRLILALVVVGLTLQVGHAQTFDAWAPGARSLADNLSTGLLVGTMGTDVTHALVIGHAHGTIWQSAGCEALKFGAVNLAAIGLKKLFPRERPDGSDNQDSFSEHTANAVVSTGYAWQVSVPAAVLVGYLRGAANRHDLVGVLEGAGLGAITRLAVTRIPVCQGGS